MSGPKHTDPISKHTGHLPNPGTQYNYDTDLARKQDQDLITYTQMLSEKFQTRFPSVLYYKLLLPTDAQSGQISTDVTKTTVDDLWGEDVPENLQGTPFLQPHSDDNIDATSGKLYAGPMQFHVQMEWEDKTKPLTKYGRDVNSTPKFIFLNAHLKQHNISIQPGDYFIFRDIEYKVRDSHLFGRWNNTDHFLYSRAVVKNDREGT